MKKEWEVSPEVKRLFRKEHELSYVCEAFARAGNWSLTKKAARKKKECSLEAWNLIFEKYPELLHLEITYVYYKEKIVLSEVVDDEKKLALEILNQ